MEFIGKYKNGNYEVSIYDDGTKVRMTEDDDFIPSYSESIDYKLTDKCNQNCQFCYEGCSKDGKHAELDLESPFFNNLHPYTEIAINGNEMDHPQLMEFLEKLREKKVIANITLHQRQLEAKFSLVRLLQEEGFIHGIGVSLAKADDKLVLMMKNLKNTVLHTICGILSENDINTLKNNGIKILILGYKDLQRGHDYKENHNDEILANTSYLNSVLPSMKDWFEVVSFDNLALEQLDVKNMVDEKEWEYSYMGDDGQFTFYVDAVRKEFARNSLSLERYPMGDMTIDEMFNKIREECKWSIQKESDSQLAATIRN